MIFLFQVIGRSLLALIYLGSLGIDRCWLDVYAMSDKGYELYNDKRSDGTVLVSYAKELIILSWKA